MTTNTKTITRKVYTQLESLRIGRIDDLPQKMTIRETPKGAKVSLNVTFDVEVDLDQISKEVFAKLHKYYSSRAVEVPSLVVTGPRLMLDDKREKTSNTSYVKDYLTGDYIATGWYDDIVDILIAEYDVEVTYTPKPPTDKKKAAREKELKKAKADLRKAQKKLERLELKSK
jgi:hypothetical protein